MYQPCVNEHPREGLLGLDTSALEISAQGDPTDSTFQEIHEDKHIKAGFQFAFPYCIGSQALFEFHVDFGFWLPCV